MSEPRVQNRKYLCVVCGYIYDEEKGDPDSNLPPGTRFEDIPEDWVCPDCGATWEDFELIGGSRVDFELIVKARLRKLSGHSS